MLWTSNPCKAKWVRTHSIGFLKENQTWARFGRYISIIIIIIKKKKKKKRGGIRAAASQETVEARVARKKNENREEKRNFFFLFSFNIQMLFSYMSKLGFSLRYYSGCFIN